jgi:hypothetical protein
VAGLQTIRGETRWWEFYAIRYGMGAVIGALVLFSLSRSNETLRSLLLLPQSQVPLQGSDIALLAAYGLIYCYIASAPILVFHAARFLLDPKIFLKTVAKWVLLPAVLVAVVYFMVATGDMATRIYGGLVLIILVILLWGQVLCVWHCLWKRHKLFQFYDKLSQKREKSVGEIVDSYRHLREHGNSFFIVMLELLLGVILYTLGNVLPVEPGNKGYLVLLFVWVLPASLVWCIATVLEREFCNSSE